MPTVLAVADMEMRAKAIEIMNNVIIEEYSKQFDYSEIIKEEKNKNGDIIMIKADTLKLNKLACDVALKAQKELKDVGRIGIKLESGYIFKNNILAYFGPKITIKMEPMGYIETNYRSSFESAGMNQTSHKIYVELKTKVRVIIPLTCNDIEIKNEIPIAETIIIGKIPNTAVQLDLKDAGIKFNNK